MRTISLAATFPAAPETLYDMYLDPAHHAAFTGSPVTIGDKPGSNFRAFDGALSGTILHTEPKRLIIQTWRSTGFADADIDSTLTLSFWPNPDGARIELLQANVPDADFGGVSEGWPKFYWTPWRAYLESSAQS